MVQLRAHEKEQHRRVKYADQNYNYKHQNSMYYSRNQPMVRYVNFFNGYCFCCSNFGHRAANCFYNFRNVQRRMSNNKQMIHQSAYHHTDRASLPTGRRRFQNRNVNRFECLNNELECYICHNFGHKATECNLKENKTESKPKNTAKRSVWKKKESHQCDLVLSVQKQKNPWYIDSGCSKHMSGDKEKFISLPEHKSGNVTYGNDAPGRIRGKGMVSFKNGKGKAQDVLFVDGLKHNLLSVS